MGMLGRKAVQSVGWMLLPLREGIGSGRTNKQASSTLYPLLYFSVK